MPSKWISLSHFKKTYINPENERLIIDRVITMAACGDLEVMAGVWVKTHYEIIQDVSLNKCLRKLERLTHEEKSFIVERHEPELRSTQHIRLGAGYMSIFYMNGKISILADATAPHPVQHVEASPPYWKDAFIDTEYDNLVFLDRSNYQRTVASQINFNWADVRQEFDKITTRMTSSRHGRPRKYYNDDDINKGWLQYCRDNPQLDWEMKYEHLRYLYIQQGLTTSRDPYFQAEKRLRNDLSKDRKS